jgi:aryl-alcohol dehydrogenase-like predicted oxidoreductase
MAETVLGDALTGERRQSLEIFTKVFGPTPQGDTTMSVSPVNTSLSPWTVP